jgi:phosphoglycerate dehydrogenase-like enzyme
MPRPTVIVVRHPEQELPAQFGTVRDVAEIRAVDSEDALRRAFAVTDIAFMWDFDSDLLARTGPGPLKWIHTNSVGLDALLTPDIVDSPATITNTRGVFERPMAKWVLAVLLYFAKDLRRTVAAQHAATWDYRLAEPIGGRRALVLGAGPVGREIAQLLRRVGWAVDIVGRRGRTDGELGPVHGVDQLDGLLPTADDVVVALPLTGSTRAIIDAPRLRLFRRGARIVNVGRGPLVDEDALAASLRSGHLAAAALDVFVREPLPTGHPFWRMDNVLVSPHMSGDVTGIVERSIDIFVDNLARWTSGRPLMNVVDKQLLSQR